MSCPAVIDVLVPSGPIVVDVVTPGPPGAIGSRWFTGASVPAADLGAVGDYYLRVNGDVYGPKASGWGAVQFTLTGAGGGASLSDSTPQTLGTAAAGTAATASRSDHRHAMPTAVDVGADAAGTAAAAIAAHVAAADAHFGYTTPAEAAAAAPVQSVVLSPPSGWGTSSANTGGSVSLAFTLPTGYSLPTNASQANWDAAYTERLQWDGGAAGLVAATGRTNLGIGALTPDGSGNLTLSARFVCGVNGAASAPPVSLTGTWFTGGTSTTTKPQFLIEPAGTTSVSWNIFGTGAAVDAPSGFQGDLVWLGKGGVPQLRVDSSGRVNLGLAAPSAATPSILNFPCPVPGLSTDTVSVNAVAVATNSFRAFNFGFRVTGEASESLNDRAAIVFRLNPGSGGSDSEFGFITNKYGASRAERLTINSIGYIGVGTTAPTTWLDVNGNTIRLRSKRTPASANAPGNPGEICWDDNYLYLCTATRGWTFVALTTLPA